MVSQDSFHIPFALPEGSLLLGPRAWCASLQQISANVVGLQSWDQLVGDVSGVIESSGDQDIKQDVPTDAARLVLIHGECCSLPIGVAGLARRLTRLAAQLPDALPVLLYRHLRTEDCTQLFRAGLFDALRVPLDRERWRTFIARLQRRRNAAEVARMVHRESEATSRRLHAHRRQLREQVAEVGQELIQAQQHLEKANRDLTDHMAQLSLLCRFGRELSTARNWDDTLRGILENLAGAVGASGAALILRSAAGSAYTPRQTYGWEGPWEKVVLKLEDDLAAQVAVGLLAPGVFHCAAEEEGQMRRQFLALPLEHQGMRLGYLLLDALEAAEDRSPYISFLQAVQVILSEEVAAAQMMDRLREMGSFNARVLETVRSGIWVVDETGRTVYANRASLELLTGHPGAPVGFEVLAEGIGRGRREDSRRIRESSPLPCDVLSGRQQPEIFLDGLLQLSDIDGVLLPQLLGRQEEPFQGEGRIMRPSGEVIPVWVQTAPMPGRGRDESWLVVVVEDLREAKKLEAARSRADSLEGLVEMSAALAHEIRNPLMGLSAQAELLAAQLPAGDNRGRYIEVITREVERINETINRLLNFVRPYAPRWAQTAVLALARDCLDLVSADAAAKDVRVKLFCTPPERDTEAWQFVLDAAQIKQVLLNLLLNAVDAAPRAGVVQLRLRRTARLELTDGARGTSRLSPGLELEVVDDGSGFPPEEIERIFRPFYTTKSTGTGLGLSICRKIVKAHGGEIQAERRQQRTYFRVLLPRARTVDGVERSQEA